MHNVNASFCLYRDMIYSKHIYSYLLTTVCLLRSTTNKSLRGPDPHIPPNSAALLSLTLVRVKKAQGEGGFPVMFGELHCPKDTCMYVIYTLHWNINYPNLVYQSPHLSEATFQL